MTSTLLLLALTLCGISGVFSLIRKLTTPKQDEAKRFIIIESLSILGVAWIGIGLFL
ncbi:MULTISPECIES: hypothetical protein [Bacillus]|uniref:hypothetical protein n=1 Tax=Bacillus TaxID=1386 RepID=UPI000B291DD2|nr:MULTISPECIES: hypothetical protein [Bacillus cereus group]MDA2480396.1 hypothetical protein [Bacillus cereus]MDA2497394.1 hypothetical protein [Bacillus cereus]HDR8040810.1 hypothetical protein [Bacillus cereus]HEF1899774.1 hypothetical protein [Bacillus cereus]